jgi:protein TonB
MSHDLLADVLRTTDRRESARRWYVLPLSIAAHAVAAAAVLIIPLAAEVELPPPARMSSHYINAVVAPAPPNVPPPHGLTSNVAPVAAPTEAPSLIEPEKNMTPTVGGPPNGLPVLGPPGVPGGIDIGQFGAPSSVIVLPKPNPEPKRIGGDIREPRKIFDVAPVYPPLAIAARKEGIVILEAVIDERGNVVRLKVLRSEPLLDGAAIAAVERWRYTPTLLNNVPVPVLMTITVRFSLR